MNIPKITILLDQGYHPEHLTQELEKVYPQIMRKIKFERSTKPSTQEKAAQGKSGFVPAVANWVREAIAAKLATEQQQDMSAWSSGYGQSRRINWKLPTSDQAFASVVVYQLLFQD